MRDELRSTTQVFERLFPLSYRGNIRVRTNEGSRWGRMSRWEKVCSLNKSLSVFFSLNPGDYASAYYYWLHNAQTHNRETKIIDNRLSKYGCCNILIYLIIFLFWIKANILQILSIWINYYYFNLFLYLFSHYFEWNHSKKYFR